MFLPLAKRNLEAFEESAAGTVKERERNQEREENENERYEKNKQAARQMSERGG